VHLRRNRDAARVSCQGRVQLQCLARRRSDLPLSNCFQTDGSEGKIRSGKIPSIQKSSFEILTEQRGIMKHLFAIAVLVMAACGWAVGDTASDERELTQLVNDLNAAIVKPDIAFLE
jgi:hypothetical protein